MWIPTTPPLHRLRSAGDAWWWCSSAGPSNLCRLLDSIDVVNGLLEWVFNPWGFCEFAHLLLEACWQHDCTTWGGHLHWQFGRQARTLAFRWGITIACTLPRNVATYRLVMQALEHYQNKSPHLQGHLKNNNIYWVYSIEYDSKNLTWEIFWTLPKLTKVTNFVIHYQTKNPYLQGHLKNNNIWVHSIEYNSKNLTWEFFWTLPELKLPTLSWIILLSWWAMFVDGPCNGLQMLESQCFRLRGWSRWHYKHHPSTSPARIIMWKVVG